MGFWIFMLCMNLLIPLSMVFFGWRFTHRPPKDINGWYGYRTRRSMASQQAWDFAHKYIGRIWLYAGVIMTVPSALVMLPYMGGNKDEIGLWGGVMTGIQCIFMLLPILPTEKALKRHFG